MIERAVVLSKDRMIDIYIIKEVLKGTVDYGSNEMLSNINRYEDNNGVLRKLEDKTIIRVLKEVNGNKVLAAKKLGISGTTLWRRLKDLEKEETSIK
ncbi:hypothetical protein SDC9_139756 [bioreactor metagenome]|uniref:DNA binding HTH domain-containing protein n=1 Tax=bioreactor metagenome TaxID=1076179 RepID=A0A645DTH1_9ZZZZ